MRNLLTPLAFVSIGLFTAPAALAADFDAGFITRLSTSVLKISASAPGNKTFSGSGVVVGRNEVLTNCHVTRNSEQIVALKGSLRYNAYSQKADLHRDLCLLITDDMPFTPTPVRATGSLATGESVFFYGYPGGIEAFFTEGRVSSLHPYLGSRVIETSAGFGLGASGGGLFDRDGAVVGITTFLSAGHSGYYYAMPADWLDELRRKPAEPLGPLAGQAVWELPVPEQPPFLQMQRLAEASDWAGALRHTTAWTTAEPDNFDAWLSHGQALLRGGKTDKAIASLQKAQAISPADANVIRSLGAALARAGRGPESEAVLAQLAPEDRDCDVAC
ncbi:MAG: trypsin-like peptidase domain-containing protein [Burkholderiales bacterium]|nr:trypsin-like peptidase domain-containing protein [Burkholderiales bacterium]